MYTRQPGTRMHAHTGRAHYTHHMQLSSPCVLTRQTRSRTRTRMHVHVRTLITRIHSHIPTLIFNIICTAKKILNCLMRFTSLEEVVFVALQSTCEISIFFCDFCNANNNNNNKKVMNTDHNNDNINKNNCNINRKQKFIFIFAIFSTAVSLRKLLTDCLRRKQHWITL